GRVRSSARSSAKGRRREGVAFLSFMLRQGGGGRKRPRTEERGQGAEKKPPPPADGAGGGAFCLSAPGPSPFSPLPCPLSSFPFLRIQLDFDAETCDGWIDQARCRLDRSGEGAARSGGPILLISG